MAKQDLIWDIGKGHHGRLVNCEFFVSYESCSGCSVFVGCTLFIFYDAKTYVVMVKVAFLINCDLFFSLFSGGG